jgi:hypothetical protein
MRSQTRATEARPDPHPALLGELLLAFARLPITAGSFGVARSQGLATAIASEVFLPHCEQRIRARAMRRTSGSDRNPVGSGPRLSRPQWVNPTPRGLGERAM